MSGFTKSSDMLVVSHSGARSGAPIVLWRFLDWLAEHTTAKTDVVLLHGGTMERDFDRFDARVLGGADSRLWMIQRGLANLSFSKAASVLALARQGPTMWANRRAPLILLNSVGSLPAIRFMPRSSPGKVVLYIHELDDSFERSVGTAAWDLLAPRVDHFLSCSSGVTEMLTQRRDIDPAKVSLQHGFVAEPVADPARTSELRHQLGIPPGSLVVGASGQPEWRKGPEVFVGLARALVERRPELDLHFVWLGGDTDDSPAWKLAHDVDAAGLHDRFHHVGETTEPQNVMAMLDVYALTSREDPYPLSMLEVASHGVPVASFDNGGVREFAAAGGSEPLAELVGYLDVEALTEAILGLLDDPDARTALGRRGRAHVLDNHVAAVGARRLFDTLAAVEPSLRRTVLDVDPLVGVPS